MLFIANAQGTILNTVPDRVYQGSNNANQVLLAIPLPSSISIKVAYKLPNGLLTEPALMTYNEQEVEGNPLNVWSIDIPEAITTYYGTVTTQFVATNSQGVKVASGSATFEVERGVAPVLPATPTQDIYDQILQALSSIKEDMLNGWLESKALLPYDSTFTYTFGAVVFNANNKELYKSLAELNKGNPLADVTKWQALGFEKAFSDIAELQSDLSALQSTVAQLGTNLGRLTQKVDTIDENVTRNTSDIADIENGTITVRKATNDADGNNIANTYQTKSNLTTGWGKVLSDTKYPSERLVKTTIDGIIASGGKQSFVFDTQADFLGWIDGAFVRPDGKVVGDVNIADDILIKEQNVPDYWCSSKSNPMTIADFTEYETKTNLTDYLAKDNTEEFTPTGDYNPATKKYVDDNGVSSVDDVNLTIGQETVTYSKQDGVTINSNGQIKYGEKTKDITVEHDIPIVAGDGVSIDKLENEEKIEIKATGTEFVELTSTIGTLTQEQYDTLMKNPANGILYNGYHYLRSRETSAFIYYSDIDINPTTGGNKLYHKAFRITKETLAYKTEDGASALPTSAYGQAGDILYGVSAGNTQTLPKGTDNQVLTMQNGLPSWQDAQGGDVFINRSDIVNDVLSDEQLALIQSNKDCYIIDDTTGFKLKYIQGDWTDYFINLYSVNPTFANAGAQLATAQIAITEKEIHFSSETLLRIPIDFTNRGALIKFGLAYPVALNRGTKGQVLTSTDDDIQWQNPQEEPYIEITNVPTSATSGTLTSDQLATLQSSNGSYILFNNEKYYLMDVQHDSGMLVYSHTGQDTANDFFIKCIAVTISTRGWVLTTLDMSEYEKVKTVYDMNSSDANINWGYTSGIPNATNITNKDFSKYKYIKVYVIGDYRCGCFVVDFNKLNKDNNYYGSGVLGAGQELSMQYVFIVVNQTKTSITVNTNTFLTGATTPYTTTTTRIEGVY